MAISSHPLLQLRDIRFTRNQQGHAFTCDPELRLTYNGRGALFLVLRELDCEQDGHVLVPAFHCPTVVDPVVAAGLTPKYYAINLDLTIDVDDVVEKIDPKVRAIVVINYFGFPANIDDLLDSCSRAGVIVIEDCAHSFLNLYPPELSGGRGQVAIYSFKKLVPSLVGGGVRLLNGMPLVSGRLHHVPFVNALVDCKNLVEQVIDSVGDANVIKRLYHRFEKFRVNKKRRRLGLPNQIGSAERAIQFDYPFDKQLSIANMPWYAKSILARTDLLQIGEVRRKNYLLLGGLLSKVPGMKPVFNELPTRICPWAFPIVVENRSEIDFGLRGRGVPVFTFGETLHESLLYCGNRDAKMVESARKLSQTMLCIPIHQSVSADALYSWASEIASVTS